MRACADGRIGGGLYQRTGSLVEPFGKGGVGVDGFEEIAGCAATLDGKGGFGDQIGSVGSGDVCSEELAAAFFNDELEQPGEFAHGLRLAELAELEHRSFHGEPLLLGLRFGEPHIPDFRGGEDGGGHHIIALRLPVFGMQDVVHGGMGFRDGHVRQHDAGVAR